MEEIQVKIVKLCRSSIKITEINENTDAEFCTAQKENFLKNVDKDILHVEDLRRFGSFMVSENDRGNEDKNQRISKISQQYHNEKSPNFPLSNLRDQVPLPLDYKLLLFNESFMISEKKLKQSASQEFGSLRNSDEFYSSSMISTSNEIDEIGSTCIMTELLDEGKILVFSTLHFTEDSKLTSQEVLSVVDSNLKLIQERHVEKFLINGTVYVSLFCCTY